MITLSQSDETVAVSELAHELAVKILEPAARQAESERAVPPSAWKAIFDSGLTTPIAEALGGGGEFNTETQCLIAENLAYGDPGIALAAMWSGAAAVLVATLGTPEQIALLKDLGGSVESHGSVALYEGFGGGLDALSATIAITDDKTVRIVGKKTAVPFAGVADSIAVVGKDPTTGVLRIVLVPTTSAGVRVGEVAGRLGLDATLAAPVSFDVEVPVACLVGGPDAQADRVTAALQRFRLLVGAVAVGTAQRAIEYASHYATERTAFGRPIAGFQGISFLLADAQIRTEAARIELASCASRIDSGDLQDIDHGVSWAVNYAVEGAAQSTRDGVQVLGGHGFLQDHPSELWYRSAAMLATLDFDVLCSSFEPAL